MFIGLVALVALSFGADAPVQAWIAAHQDATWIAVARAISRYGAWQWLMLGCAICAAILLLRKKRAALWFLAFAMISSSVAGLLADTTRGLTGRTRPNAELDAGWFGARHDGRWLLGDARYHAFPSGHTAAATALIAPLLLARRRAGWLLLPLPVAIAASRVYIGAHHFSDVVAGAALGIGVAIFLGRFYSSNVPVARNPSALTSKTSRLTG